MIYSGGNNEIWGE